MKLITTLAAVCLSASALAQGVRYDHRVATIATNYPPGAQVPVMAIPNAQVTICVDGNCGTRATIFSNQTLTVPTSNPMQADGQGNFGFWAAGGTYFYKVVEPSGKVNGIFPITLGGSGGTSAVTQIIAGQNITISPTNGLGAVTINSLGSPAFQTNGAANLSQTLLDLDQGANITVTNTSGGHVRIDAAPSTGVTPQLVPPIAGQFVVLYPSAGTITLDESAGRSSINNTSGNFVWVCTGVFCSIADNTAANWSGFALPSFVNPANVTAIYADAITSAQAQTQMPTGGSNLTSLICGSPGSPQLLPLLSSPSPWQATEVTQLLSIPASSIASLSCPIVLGTSTSSSRSGESINVSAIRLIVYYTGTPPPADGRTQIVPPLTFNADLNQLAIDPLGVGYLQPLTVLTLPSALASTGKIFQVTDGTSSTDCTTGGGSTPVLCRSNGTVWSNFGSGGGSSGFPFTLGSTSIAAGSTTTAVAGLSVNGVTLNAGGSATTFLNGAGGYTTPAGSGGTPSVGTAGQLQMVGSTAGSFAASSATDNGANLTVSKPLVVNDGTGKAGAIQLQAGTAPSAALTSTIQINAPTAVTAYSVTLPAAQGTGALTNNGAGVLSWTPSGGGISLTTTGTSGAATLTGSTLNIPVYTGGGGGAALQTCVAASASGTTYTCTSSGTLSSLANGTTIAFQADITNTGAATLNVNSLGAKNINKQGGVQSLIAGDVVGLQWLLLTYDGTQWQDHTQIGLAALPAFNWINQGSSTVIDSAGTEQLTHGQAVGTISARYITAPTPPYTLTTQIIPNWVAMNGKDVRFGLIFGESSTGKIAAYTYMKNTSDAATLAVDNWTNFSTFSAEPFNVNGPGYLPLVSWPSPAYSCQRIRDDGTNLLFYYSVDCINFIQATSIARTSFMSGGPNQIGYFIYSATSGAHPLETLMKWAVVNQ